MSPLGVLHGRHERDLDRRGPTQSGVVTLKGDWHTDRQYVELKKRSGEIRLPVTAGEVNLVTQPARSGVRPFLFYSMESQSAPHAEWTSARMELRASIGPE